MHSNLAIFEYDSKKTRFILSKLAQFCSQSKQDFILVKESNLELIPEAIASLDLSDNTIEVIELMALNNITGETCDCSTAGGGIERLDRLLPSEESGNVPNYPKAVIYNRLLLMALTANLQSMSDVSWGLDLLLQLAVYGGIDKLRKVNKCVDKIYAKYDPVKYTVNMIEASATYIAALIYNKAIGASRYVSFVKWSKGERNKLSEKS